VQPGRAFAQRVDLIVEQSDRLSERIGLGGHVGAGHRIDTGNG
jgi:hypothetical protein